VSVPLAILEAAQAAALPARAVSDAAAITAGVEAALAADRRCWGRWLLDRLGELPITATQPTRVRRRAGRGVLRSR
jgi:hypothetical protein